MKQQNLRSAFFLFVLTLLGVAAQAQALRLPRYFADHAVLQREKAVPLWGWAAPGRQISVVIAGDSYTGNAGRDGIWNIALPAKPAGGPYVITIADGRNKITLEDIYFGDVFFCSGQSNMVFTMKKEEHRKEEEADYPLIRQFLVSRNTAITPEKDLPRADWIVSGSQTIDRFSAVAYYFAKEIYTRKKIPVGIILSAYGGSPIEAFMNKEALRDFPEARSKADKITPKFIRETEEANERLLAANPGKKEPNGFVNIKNRYPTMLYNGMIAPFFSYPIKGVLWYQGEANTPLSVCYDYEKMLTNLIDTWRQSWNDAQLPFFCVQLPNYGKHLDTPNPTGSGWAIVQEGQSNVRKNRKNVYMAVTNDIGSGSNLHPTNKKDVGNRLAALALYAVYGDEDNAVQGPTLKEAVMHRGKAELSFDHVGKGLMIKEGGRQLFGFALAGDDKKFHRASAEIVGERVVVSCQDVPHPVYVRYAFESNPGEINFYNQDGFPAVPFRTDQLRDANTRF